VSRLEIKRLLHEEQELKQLLNDMQLRKFVVQNPIILQSVDSTQSYMANELKSWREGDIVVSKVQTAGRGRGGRSWISQIGGLWMTITLLPNIEILASIPLIASESIAKTLCDYGTTECNVKLPNDVYCGGKKIAGVLADAVIQETKSIMYLGMGINVNNDPVEIVEISKIATSLSREIGRKVDLVKFTASLIQNLDIRYNRDTSDQDSA
jgi:BirA family transcriptional regulator, biotin operon repressor / biotin---[acetyl-CoA-carboxylase] ligase